MINDTLERRHTRFFFQYTTTTSKFFTYFPQRCLFLGCRLCLSGGEPHCAPNIWFQALSKPCYRAFQFMQDGKRVSSHLRLGDRPKRVIYWGEVWALKRSWPFRETTDDAIVKMASRRIFVGGDSIRPLMKETRPNVKLSPRIQTLINLQQ